MSKTDTLNLMVQHFVKMQEKNIDKGLYIYVFFIVFFMSWISEKTIQIIFGTAAFYTPFIIEEKRVYKTRFTLKINTNIIFDNSNYVFLIKKHTYLFDFKTTS